MRYEKKCREELERGKNQEFRAGTQFRSRVLQDRTFFNMDAFRRTYKLGQAYRSLKNLEYRFEGSFKDQTFQDYLKFRGDLLTLKFTAEQKPRPDFPEDEGYRNARTNHLYPKGDMIILVDSSLYEGVSLSLDQYILDVGRDGYWATVHTVRGGTPVDVRSYIKELNPVGVLMVGAVAVPWFEMDNDFHGAHSEFPCDLYYMDTNAIWNDPDGNGKFNNVAGNVDPEIWVGRIYTPTAGGNDAALVNDYFKRNHMFRIGALGHARSALAYVDDDWQGFGNCDFDEMFPASAITKYTNPDVTDADLFKAEVNSLRSWVQLCAHSWTHGHSLRVPSENTSEFIDTSYFRDTNPPNAHFYNLFCCGPGKFTTDDYMAGWYIFDKSGGGTNNGLVALASAKSGSMLFFEDFYRPLGQGKVIGDAYVDWWKSRGPSHDDGERQWFYGMVLLGDPTLSWWKGAVPQLQQPQQEDVFDHWPRKMQLMWDQVNLPGASYTVEVDAFHAVNTGKWAEETGEVFLNHHNITVNTYNHNFVGMQRGRWRVRAQIDGTNCSWSPWSYFRFTV